MSLKINVKGVVTPGQPDQKGEAAAGAEVAVADYISTPHQQQQQQSPFYCSVCNITFRDETAARIHKISKRHLRATGELEQQRRDAQREVTVDDLRALVERKMIEKRVVPFSQLRYQKRTREDDDFS